MSLLVLALAALAGGETLDGWVASSAALHSFSASYSYQFRTADVPQASGTMRIDYVAPDRVRLDQAVGEQRASTCCSAGILELRSLAPGQPPLHGRVDCAALLDSMQPIEEFLCTSFDLGPRGAVRRGVTVGMRWDYDTQGEQANYKLEAAYVNEPATPFGWLEELSRKSAEPRIDGDLARFETDTGAFQIALERASGFMREFDGHSPKGELHFRATAVELDGPIDAERFRLPAPEAGSRDVSAELQKSFNRDLETIVRTRIYRAIAVEPSGEPWSPERRARIDALWRRFYERSLALLFASWHERSVKVRDGVSERLRKMRTDGKTEEEVEAARQREIGFLSEQLDRLEEPLRTRLGAPPLDEPLPRTEELLEIERQIVVDVFRATLRDPVTADFARAPAEAVK